MINMLRQLLRDETGLETAEKAALVVFALILAVATYSQVAPKIKQNFTTTNTKLDAANSYVY